MKKSVLTKKHRRLAMHLLLQTAQVEQYVLVASMRKVKRRVQS